MMDWRYWCRLCGNCEEENVKVDSDAQEIVEQKLEISLKDSSICYECNAYVKDFRNFILKVQDVNRMFLELELKSATGEASQELAFSLRRSNNLPCPDFDLDHESESDMTNDLLEIEDFKIESQAEDTIEGVEEEYLIESEHFEAEVSQMEAPENLHVLLKADTNDPEYLDDEEIIYTEVFETATTENFEVLDFTADESGIRKNFQFMCHVCNEEFDGMENLEIHTESEHECQPQVPCKCGKMIETTSCLLIHYNDHVKKNFSCSLCNKSYKTEANFRSHLALRHGKSGEKKFTCDTCGRKFKEARHLTVHMNTHLPEDQKFVHECVVCNKKYSSIFSLRHHIKVVHVNFQTLNCPHCDKTFSRKANLDSHMNHVHTTERNFECEICGLKVKTKGILKNHKKIHSTNPDDLMTCEVCQKQFKTQNQLINHRLCHTSEKKKKCTYCPAEYKRSKELEAHISSVHTGQPRYSCLWCDKNFFNNSNYRKHKLKVHPRELEEYENRMKEPC